MKKLTGKFGVLALLALSGAIAHADPEAPGFHDESEAGVVVTSGNSDSQSLNFATKDRYIWDSNAVRIVGKYLDTSSNRVTTALYYTLGVRYERILDDSFSVFAGELMESDRFSGYFQRYATDGGGKYFIDKEEAFHWDVELGYRYLIENRLPLVPGLSFNQVNQSYLRLYTEAARDFTKTFQLKADVEYLPNLSQSDDWQLNTEIAVAAALSDIFAIKVGYLVKYRNLLLPNATKNTDTQFTTALVAKF